MAVSPTIHSRGIVNFIITTNGSAIPDEFGVFSIYIEKKVNQVPVAKIVIIDGDPATGKFEASSSNTFLPGADILIKAGYDSKNELLFKGIITGQSMRIDQSVGATLEIECRDPTVKMTVGRNSRSFSQMRDSDIITSVIDSHGLSSGVTSTTTVWPEQVQYDLSDWDFILTLAEANGMIVMASNGKVLVAGPGANASPVLKVQYGVDLIEFNARLNSITQLSQVKANAWDYKNQVVSSAEALNDYPGPGNLSSKQLSGVIGLSNYLLQTPAPLEQSALTDWSKAQMIKSEYSKIQGIAKFQGTHLAEVGNYITLEGLGDRFNGDHFISGVIHHIAEGNWITESSIGLSPEWLTEQRGMMFQSAAGVSPRIKGLFTGTVRQIADDPDSQYRILVDIPLLEETGAGIWARLSNFYATNNAGAFFLPEIGDEVILGFLNEDPRYPVILGSMYSTKIKPLAGLEPKDENPLKAIVSRSGIRLQFDDKNKIFTILTPGSNSVVMSDQDRRITVNDQNGNSIVMSDNGIEMKSSKNITIEAGQKLILKGTQGISLESTGGDVNVEGLNIKETASVEYTMDGGQVARLSSGANLTLKSGIIMIN